MALKNFQMQPDLDPWLFLAKGCPTRCSFDWPRIIYVFKHSYCDNSLIIGKQCDQMME